MASIQLELNLDNKSSEKIRLDEIQNHIEEINKSMGKVRRKLFLEISEMKKLYADLLKENEELKTILKEMKNEKTQWKYGQNGYLFDV